MTPSETLGTPGPGQSRPWAAAWARHAPLGALLLGLLVLYAPTVWSLSHGLWQDDTHAHGPLVLLGVLWLFVHGVRAHVVRGQATAQPRPVAGGIVLGLGLLLYVLGRSQGLYVLEVGSAIPVVLGGVLLTWGTPLARKLWFAFVFMLFLVPLPGSLIDTITQPMKIAVSWAAEHLMYAAGYPVARAGVVLGIGPYQLFVADACAGLNSLFMLEAFGLLYLNVIRHESALRNAVLAVLIVPISFVANVLRVVVLALVTYHWGDAAGQGFIHTFSGVVLFGVALGLTVAADSLVRPLAKRWERSAPATPLQNSTPVGRTSRQSVLTSPVFNIAALLAASVAAAAAIALTPTLRPASVVPDLEAAIPKQLGDWTMVPLPYVPVDVVVAQPGRANILNPYDQVVMRAYQNSNGSVVALAVAYGANQRQEIKLHQPILCYVGQGFHIAEQRAAQFAAPGRAAGPIPGTQLVAESPQGNEAVSYWLRIGDVFSESAWQTRWHIFKEGLRGNPTDGVLVRASSALRTTNETSNAFTALDDFLAALVGHSSPELRLLIAR